MYELDFVDEMLMKQTRIKLIHKESHGEYDISISIHEEFSRYDPKTRTRYFISYIVGKIIKKTERTFWFGYKKEVIAYRKILGQHTLESEDRVLKYLRSRLKKIKEGSV